MSSGSPSATPPTVVVGASAGGVEALRSLVAGLPAGLPACVLVVLHVPSTATSALPGILDRAGPLPARHAVDGDPLVAGQVLVAPPDHHMVVLDGRVALTRGPQENGHRPAVDVLFRSAARSLGPRLLAVVLSGSLDDGAAGSVAVAERGGTCLAQHDDDALYAGMPRAAAAAVGMADQDRVLVADLPARIVSWLAERPHTDHADHADHGVNGVDAGHEVSHDVSELMEKETAMADLDPVVMHQHDRPGSPSGFGCPDCAGALFQIDEGGLRRYRCRVGHAWSAESLLARQTVGLESALWMALRTLEEKAALSDDLERRAAAGGHTRTAARFATSAHETRRAAELVRQLVADLDSGVRTGFAEPDEAPR